MVAGSSHPVFLTIQFLTARRRGGWAVPAGLGTSRVPVAFQLATIDRPGTIPSLCTDSSVISATIDGKVSRLTRIRFPTPAILRTGPDNRLSADPDGSSADNATSHG
jgi:hypothetical protein